MEAPGFNWLHRFRSGSHFLDMPGAAGAPTVGAKVTDTTFRL